MQKSLMWLLFLATFFAANAYSQTLGSVANNITGSLANVAKLIMAGAYVGGTAMFLIALFQFRQHKENPTQVPLSKPMMFLAIAGGLLFLPSVITVTGKTIFGTATMGTPTGKAPGGT